MNEENRQVTVFNPDDDFAPMRPQDQIVSRLRLQQSLSPAVTAGRLPPGCFSIDDLEVGIERGKNSLIIPLMFWFQWVEFNPNMDAPKKEKVLAKSVDPTSKLAQEAQNYVTVINSLGKKVNKVTESYNFVVLAPMIGGYDRFFVTSFQRSAHKVAKMWLNRMHNMRVNGAKINMWRNSWELGAEFKDEGPQKKYFVPVIDKPQPVAEDRWAFLNATSSALREQRAAMAARELERAGEDEHDEADAKEAAKKASDEAPY